LTTSFRSGGIHNFIIVFQKSKSRQICQNAKFSSAFLFNLHKEYMSHSLKDRALLYDEYSKKREEIRMQLLENKKQNNQ
jgi:hypothetical protein